MSRYNRLYHDRSVDWPLGGLCHDTVDCIVTSRQPGCRRVTIQLIVS